MNRGTALRLAGLAISVGAVVLLLQTVDVGSTAAVLRTASPLPLVLALGLLLGELVLRALRWTVLLPVAATDRPPVRRILPVLTIGYLGNVLLPARLGEPVRAYLLAQREGLDGHAVFGSVILERILDTVTLAAVAVTAVLYVGGPEWLRNGTILALAGSAAIAGGVLVVANRAARANVAAGAGGPGQAAAPGRTWHPAIRRLLRAISSVVGGWVAGRHPRRILAAAAISAFCWGVDGAVFWLVGRSIGLDLAIPAAVLIAAVTVLGTAVPSAPAYLGTYELAASGVAALVGVPPASALALAILAHALTVLPVAGLGAVSLVAYGANLDTLVRRSESVR